MEEPRLADRFDEQGSDLEQPLAIARDISNLYYRLSSYKKLKNKLIFNSQ